MIKKIENLYRPYNIEIDLLNVRMTEEMNPWEGFVFLFAPGIILLFSLIWLMFDWPAILRELCTKR